MRPISYYPVIEYKVPKPTHFVSRVSGDRAEEIDYKAITPELGSLSGAVADLSGRILKLSSNSNINPKTLTDFFLADPSSDEGKEAYDFIQSGAGGFMGNPDLRKALALEPVRIMSVVNIESALTVMGIEDPDRHARVGLPDEIYRDLGAIEESLSGQVAVEAQGRLKRIDRWASRIAHIFDIIQSLLDKESSISVMSSVKSDMTKEFASRVKLIMAEQMREVDQKYWESINRAKNAVRNIPKIVGPDAIRERIVFEWADLLVKEAEEWVREYPEAERFAAEIIMQLGNIMAYNRTMWEMANECDEAIQRAAVSALDTVKPMLMFHAILDSFG